MTKKATISKLAETKAALAAKCERLANLTLSKPKRKTLLHHADSYRRQAEQLAKQAK